MPAAADQDDALNVIVGGAVNYDSNLFRRPDSANPESDVFKTGYVGLRIDKPYAQQRFQLEATETATRYNKFSNLDFDGLGYRGAWLWHLTPRISGTLGADRTESLVPFEDTLGTTRNVRISQNRQFTLDGWVTGGWHVLLGLSQSEQKSEQPSLAAPDFRSVSEEGGVRYEATSGSSVTATQRAIQGHYINSVFDPANSGVDGYRQDESELKANWILNGRSTASGRMTWIERRNDHFTQGDFSGLAGELGYHWTPTGKLRFDFSARRDIGPFQDLASNSTYRVDDVLSFAPTWQASTRVAIRMRLERIQSDFRGGSAALNIPSRSDTTNTALLGVTWTPLRAASIGASVQHEWRSSTSPLFEYDDTIANIGASLMF